MLSKLYRWGPAILMMVVIFLFSAIPSSDLPNFYWADLLIKKSGHAIGFGLLALSYWRGLGMNKRNLWLAWFLAIAFAVSDEFHQSLTPGRFPSLFDVLVDGIGAGLSLSLVSGWMQRIQE